MRRYIVKSNHLKDAEKYNIKELIVADMKQNESVALEMNAVD